MAGQLIFSLDCEGRWGAADKQHLHHNQILTERNLREAYGEIIEVFETFAVPATFAFVGCFVMSENERQDIRARLEAMAVTVPYIGAALSSMDDDGWRGAWALEAVASSGVPHEIALHGMTHVPWSQLSHAAALQEIGLLQNVRSLSDVKTFVFPRNEIAHVDILKQHGFLGYREARTYRIPKGHMLDELNPFSPPDKNPISSSAPVPIPPGYFLNWRYGLRRSVPKWLSGWRSRNIIGRSGGKLAHFWTHPENFVSAPDTIDLLRQIVRRAADARDAGHLEILTQEQYCTRSLNKDL